MPNVRKLIEEYLTEAKLMQIATVKDNKRGLQACGTCMTKILICIGYPDEYADIPVS